VVVSPGISLYLLLMESALLLFRRRLRVLWRTADEWYDINRIHEYGV